MSASTPYARQLTSATVTLTPRPSMRTKLSWGRRLTTPCGLGDVTRDELFITSKVWHDSHGANKVDAAFSESLKKLQLDYLTSTLFIGHGRKVGCM